MSRGEEYYQYIVDHRDLWCNRFTPNRLKAVKAHILADKHTMTDILDRHHAWNQEFFDIDLIQNDGNRNHMTNNRVLDFKHDTRIGEDLKPRLGGGRVNLSDVKIGKLFQFAGDKYTVRQVIDVDGEFVLLRTLGNMDELKYYKMHFSWLHPNQSPVWRDVYPTTLTRA